MEMRTVLEKVVKGINLTEGEVRIVMERMMEGGATPSQMAAFLVAMRVKGETVEEITGFVRAMRDRASRLSTCRTHLVDTCGTGGDGRQTFNISTTVALVVAGAGVGVAKHGNRSVSSRCGSADVLECLGVNVDLTPDVVGRCLDDTGIAFIFASRFHGAMKYVAVTRKEIGIRTVFNILGPLTNPAGARAQVLGIYDASLTEVLAAVLQRLGIDRAYVVHGSDGMDEITLTGRTKITELKNNRLRTFYLAPEQVGLKRAPLKDLLGGSAVQNASITKSVLEGELGPCRDIVLLNAAFTFMAAGIAATPREGIELASRSIDSGAALNKLRELIAFSRSCASCPRLSAARASS